MTVHLPEDLERYVQSQVLNGHFVSADAAIAEAVRLLQQRRQSASFLSKSLTEEEFEQKIHQAGLLGSVPPRTASAPSHFKPISIAGAPLSETVIHERR